MVEVALVLGWKSFDWWRRQRRILDEGNSGQGRMRKESKGHVLRWVKNVYIEVPGRADLSQKGIFKKDVGWFTELPRWLKKQVWRLCSLELYWSLRWGTTRTRLLPARGRCTCTWNTSGPARWVRPGNSDLPAAVLATRERSLWCPLLRWDGTCNWRGLGQAP